MSGLLLYGDTERSPALRHELPITILDPLLYAEQDGRTWIMSSVLEAQRIHACRPDATLIDINDLGFLELLHSDRSRDEIELELASRAAARTAIKQAVIDFDFPASVADRLRADGMQLTVDGLAVTARRRRKTEHELAGIRRAQSAANAAIAAAASMLGQAQVDGDAIALDGHPLRAEAVRAAMREAAWEHGAVLPGEVIVASVWQGTGHNPGAGVLPARLPIQVDVWPLDTESGCWADMTRTFVVGGEPPEEIRRQEELVRQALDQSIAAVRPGVTGRELHEQCCELFEAAGYPTQRTGSDVDPNEGFQYSLGHGVGLRVHEAPAVGQSGHDPFIAGDVLALEPGLWRLHVGGVRFEDLVLVTEDGCEVLSDFSYELTPEG